MPKTLPLRSSFYDLKDRIAVNWQPEAPRTNRGWIVLLASMTIIMPIGIEMYIPGMPAIAEGLNTDILTTQLTMTAFLFGAAAGQFVGGPISDLVGRRRPVLAGLVMFGASMWIGALAPSIGVLIASRALTGIGAGVVVVCTNATVRDRYSGMNVARTFSQILVISALAPVIGPPIAAAVMRVTGWRGLLAFLGIVTIVLLVFALRSYPEAIIRRVDEIGWLSRMRADGSALVRDRNFVGYCIVLLLASAAFFASASGSAFVLQQEFGMSALQYSLVLAVNCLGVVGVSLFAARHVHTFGPRRMLVGGVVLMLVTGTLLLFSIAGSLPVLLVGLFTLNLAIGLISPAARGLAPHDHAERAGSAYAILGVSQFVVSGLAAPLTGLLPWSTLTSLAVVVAGLAAAAACAVFVTSRSGTAVTSR